MMNLNLKDKNSLFKILMILLLVYSGINLLLLLILGGTFWNWISTLAFGAVGVILLVKKVDIKYISIPLGIITLIYLIGFFRSFGYYYGIFVSAISNLLLFAGMGIITFYTIRLWKLDFLKKFDFSILSKFWFVPAICAGVSLFFELIGNIRMRFLFGYRIEYGFLAFLLNVVFIIILLLLGKCFAPEGEDKNAISKTVNVNSSNANVNSNVSVDGYCDMAKHVLLLLFTCGIWNYIWIYRVTKYLNNTPGEEYRDPTNKLLLCLFVPFYNIYWIYQSARRIDVLAKSRGVDSDIATVSLVLAIFVPIVAPIIMQSKINQICTSNGGSVNSNVVNNSSVSAADELKKYKELLDDGAITKKEYEAKKKQLLDL